MTKSFYLVLFFLVIIEGMVIIFYTQQDYFAPFFVHSLPAIEGVSTQSVQSVVNQFSGDGTQSPSPNSSASLNTIVQDALVGTNGSYSIVIKNLKTGEQFSLKPDQEYQSGSLYKLWVMATVYQQIEAGQLSLDQTLSADVTTLNSEFNIDDEDAELTSGTITMTVQDALTQMITISHNYAALLLTEKIKLSTVAKFLLDNGFNNSKVGTDGSDPKTNAADMALFIEKLYHGQLISPKSSEAMLTLLKQQQLNNKLPKLLPPNTIIAHKTGELWNVTHDVGIVYGPSSDYIIAILSESDNPPAAEERIANVSKAVFNYFSAK